MEKTYYELCITPTKHHKLFSEFLFDLGIEAIEERDNSIIVRDEEDLSEIEWAVERFARELSKTLKDDDIKVSQKLEKKLNIDWIEKYKNSIQPIEIGRFYVHPTWEKDKEGFINILIDPALSFGTGHHESTSSCLELISETVKKGDTFLDVGCGSGILSIAAAKLGAKVELCDTDPLSIESAKKNFSLNGVKYEDIWVGSADKAKKEYDTVVANIVADILIMISKDLKKSVKNDANLILSGILDKYLDKVLSKFNDFQLIKIIKKGEWRTIYLKKGK
jgi:ribosomal protein L11 methyltransferase